jgi:hypothetical protein
VAAAYPRRQLHVVVDNYATHKHPAVRAWLARHPRITLHVTPTSGSWLNVVEAFFSNITREALRRGSFPTVADLIAAIQPLIDAWNDRCRPFTRTKDPDTVIAKATDPRKRRAQTTSVAEHWVPVPGRFPDWHGFPAAHRQPVRRVARIPATAEGRAAGFPVQMRMEARLAVRPGSLDIGEPAREERQGGCTVRAGFRPRST